MHVPWSSPVHYLSEVFGFRATERAETAGALETATDLARCWF